MRIPILLLFVCVLTFGLLLAGCDDDDDDNTSSDDDIVDDDTVSDDDIADDDIADNDIADDDIADDDIADDDTSPPPPTTNGFSYIPAGVFPTGSPESEPGHRDNEIQHDITLTRHFEMKSTEVSQDEFKQVMDYNPGYYPLIGQDTTLPVEQVSWYDALAFTNKASEIFGYAPCYELDDIICADETSGNTNNYCKRHGGIATATVSLNGVDEPYACEGFRLPTEAEWEYAARAGTTTAFYNGPIENVTCDPIDENLDQIAWYCGNADRHTHPVAEKQPNDWGLYDMLGNVKEWVWDIYAHDNTGQSTDPVGATDGRYRMVRGGSARFHGAARNRAAVRTGHTPDYRVFTLGFRPVRTLPEETPALRPSPAYPYPQISPAEQIEAKDWPDELPFTFTRAAAGDPLTPAEITAFTEAITSFWVDNQYFPRYRWISHGMVEDNGQGWPAFKLYFQVNSGTKTDDVVEIRHTGNSDNLMIRTGKIFNSFASLYLASGDELAAYMIKQYCQGVAALIQGFVWSEDDPEQYIMPRTIFVTNHTYTEEGREAYVNYEPAKKYEYDWNGWTIPNPTNPSFGDIWVRTMRSKDDVPHIYRMLPLLYRLEEEAPDEDVREAVDLALHYLKTWVGDIVDTGYFIRSKEEDGNTFIPMNKDYPFIVNDLASFTIFDPVAPNAECNPELASALIAYGEPLGVDCGNGGSYIYDYIATSQHYFNAAIIRYFHIDAVLLALMYEENDAAYELLEGLAERVDTVFDNEEGQTQHTSYDADTASFMLTAATAGLPLTNEEARHIVEEYTTSIEHFNEWAYWDLWDESVPNGSVQIKPSNTMSPEKTVVRETEMAYLIDYCYSPFRNTAGADLVDCNVILNPDLWGAPIE